MARKINVSSVKGPEKPIKVLKQTYVNLVGKEQRDIIENAIINRTFVDDGLPYLGFDKIQFKKQKAYVNSLARKHGYTGDLRISVDILQDFIYNKLKTDINNETERLTRIAMTKIDNEIADNIHSKDLITFTDAVKKLHDYQGDMEKLIVFTIALAPLETNENHRKMEVSEAEYIKKYELKEYRKYIKSDYIYKKTEVKTDVDFEYTTYTAVCPANLVKSLILTTLAKFSKGSGREGYNIFLVWPVYVANYTSKTLSMTEIMYRQMDQYIRYGLIDHSEGKKEGECVVDLLWAKFQLNKDGSAHTIGGKNNPLVREHIVKMLCNGNESQLSKGFKLADIDRVCEYYRPAFLKIFDSIAVNDSDAKPIFEKYYTNVTAHNKLDGISIFVVGNHVFEDNRPKLKDFDYNKHIIVEGAIDNITSLENGIQMIFSTDPNNLVDKYAKDLLDKKIIPIILKHDTSDNKILKMIYNDILFIFNPNIHLSLKLCSDYSVEFRGQNLNSILLEIAHSLDYMPKSIMSTEVFKIYNNDFAQTYANVGYFNESDIKKPYKILDCKRAYTNAALMAQIPILGLHDDFEKFDVSSDIKKYGQYVVVNCPAAKDCYGLMNGPSIYPGEVITEALKYNYIQKSDISHALLAKSYIKMDKLVQFTEEVTDSNNKYIFNSLWGLTKRTSNINSTLYMYSSYVDEVKLAIKDKNDFSVTVVNLNDIKGQKNKEYDRNNISKLEVDLDETKNILYLVQSGSISQKYNNDLIFHLTIPKLNNLHIFREIKKLQALDVSIYGISTDAIKISHIPDSYEIKSMEDIMIGDFKIEVKEWKISNVFDDSRQLRYKDSIGYIKEEWMVTNIKPITDYSFKISKSLCIYGKAGCGKTFYAAGEILRLHNAGFKVLVSAATNAAKDVLFEKLDRKVPVHTLHNVLGFREDASSAISIPLLDRTTDYLFIDEFICISHNVLCKLKSMRNTIGDTLNIVLLCGQEQLGPVEKSGKYDIVVARDSNKLKIYGSFIKDLIEGKYLNLTKDFRSIDPILHSAQDKSILTGKIPDDIFNTSSDILAYKKHLCYTNKRVDELNYIITNDQALKLGKKIHTLNDNYIIFEGMPVVAGVNTLKYKNGSKFTINQINDIKEKITLNGEIEISFNTFMKHFKADYATTFHKSQGSTFFEPYMIHESDNKIVINTDGLCYVAITRGTMLKNIVLFKSL